jgi:hypothetical protein
MAYDLRINGERRSVDVDGDTPLLWVIRDVLGMTGTKYGCGIAQCGACTVHIDGAPARACQTPVESVGSSAIATIEAIHDTTSGLRVQKAWQDRCGRRRGRTLQVQQRAHRIQPLGAPGGDNDRLVARRRGHAQLLPRRRLHR